ncbi:MAG: discoidin domain-containing protein [Parafilimonas sp.]
MSKNTSIPNAAFDGSLGTRWESNYNDNQWLYVDLSSAKTISGVDLFWEAAYGKSYKIQTSNDAINWTDVYSTTTGDGGTDEISFPQTSARYVRMLGIKRGTVFGYSLWELEVYSSNKSNLSDVHFLKLQLKDASGKIISDNFYWRSKDNNYTSLNSLPVINLNINSQTSKQSDKYYIIDAKIKNPSSAGIVFAVHVQVVNARTGERILPVFMNDNYFSIVKGETKNLHIEFDTSLVLSGDSVKLVLEQYSQGNFLQRFSGKISSSDKNTKINFQYIDINKKDFDYANHKK